MGQTLTKRLDWETVDGERRLKDIEANDDIVAELVQVAKTLGADPEHKDVSNSSQDKKT